MNTSRYSGWSILRYEQVEKRVRKGKSATMARHAREGWNDSNTTQHPKHNYPTYREHDLPPHKPPNRAGTIGATPCAGEKGHPEPAGASKRRALEMLRPPHITRACSYLSTSHEMIQSSHQCEVRSFENMPTQFSANPGEILSFTQRFPSCPCLVILEAGQPLWLALVSEPYAPDAQASQIKICPKWRELPNVQTAKCWYIR